MDDHLWDFINLLSKELNEDFIEKVGNAILSRLQTKVLNPKPSGSTSKKPSTNTNGKYNRNKKYWDRKKKADNGGKPESPTRKDEGPLPPPPPGPSSPSPSASDTKSVLCLQKTQNKPEMSSIQEPSRVILPLEDPGTPTLPVTEIHDSEVPMFQIEPTTETKLESPSNNGQFHKFLANLKQQGRAKKYYLEVKMEGEITQDGLVDTAADISLISAKLFHFLHERSSQAHRELKLCKNPVNLQAYTTAVTKLDQIALCHIQIGDMSLVHPFYVSPLNNVPLLLGVDLWQRFDPLIDLKNLKIHATVREPKPLYTNPTERMCMTVSQIEDQVEPDNPIASEPETSGLPASLSTPDNHAFLCSLKPSVSANSYAPGVREGVIIDQRHTADVVLALGTERSAISSELFEEIQKLNGDVQLVPKSLHLPVKMRPTTDMRRAKGLCILPNQWENKYCTHAFMAVSGLPQSVFLGADIAVRMAVTLDTVNQVLWSRIPHVSSHCAYSAGQLVTTQTIPELSNLINEFEVTVPARTSDVPIRVNVRPGHELVQPLNFYQPSRLSYHLGLSTTSTPLLSFTGRTAQVLVNNHTDEDIRIPKATLLGSAISADWHDLDLTIPVIGEIPPNLDPLNRDVVSVHTYPTGIIRVALMVPICSDAVGRIELDQSNHMTVYHIETSTSTNTAVTEELPLPPPPNETLPYPLFENHVQEVLQKADAMGTVKKDFHKLLYKYKNIFAKDSLDCGVTDIHTVSIPTYPGAPPTYVRQYKIPLASHEPVRKIINELLERGIIRLCNSSYSSPIWPVKKADGKSWRLAIDYRALNKTVPLSRWPMSTLSSLNSEHSRDAKVFSSLDVRQGFWNLKVKQEDQHKLAFTFANKQYTWNRCPFGYSNAPAEFNIFLNKACPDAASRGTLLFVDDILIRSKTPITHLAELEHLLSQLEAAGVKLALQKGQWFRTKVNYVGLQVGPDGVSPQIGRVQGVQNLKVPTNVRELQSFLGVCNYSRQFIEGYADIARPLNDLLKKSVPFVWTEAQTQAMNTLKDRLRTAPCLAYPRPDRPYYLEAGYSPHCLSAGLYQMYDGDRRVVAYASKTLSPVEQKFSDCEKALFAAVWAVTYFSNYVGGQKIIIETCHQPVTFLNSQRIREGVVTNQRIAAWLVAFQSHDIEVNYAQNHKNALGTDLAACQNCTDAPQATQEAPTEWTLQPNARYHYYDDNVCKEIPMAYTDGCSYMHQSERLAGAGIVWIGDFPCRPLSLKLGPMTSQYAEVAAILITFQCAVEHNIREFTICTDSNYCRLSFLCHLSTWEKTNFLTAGRKPVKHKDLFIACDHLARTHDMRVYWKKVRGHSRLPGTDKTYNDLTDALAKEGALSGNLWKFKPEWLPTIHSPSVSVITRKRAAEAKAKPTETNTTKASDVGPSGIVPGSSFVQPADLLSMQQADPDITRMVQILSDPCAPPITDSELNASPDLRQLMTAKKRLHLVDGLLTYAPDEYTNPRLVIPRDQRGMFMTLAHDLPCAGHRGTKATHDELSQVAYWPGMHQDINAYINGCLVCAQFQPANPIHRAPLQNKGITFPWSHIQIDWVGPLRKTSRGNCYFLTIVDSFTKYPDALPARNCSAETTACLLLNRVFAYHGFPVYLCSDKGAHFTANVIRKVWEMVGVKEQLHISFHPQSSGEVERLNKSVTQILKKYTSFHQKDWDLKLPLVLMAIRATPHASTGFPPIELLTGRRMNLPLNLLYSPEDSSIVTALTTHEYIEALRDHLRYAFAFAHKNLQATAIGQKTYYDQKASNKEFQVGDKVWYYIFAPPGLRAQDSKLSKKLLPRWSGPYKITEKLSPVAYRIKLEKSKEKWVHRNQIKPFHPPLSFDKPLVTTKEPDTPASGDTHKPDNVTDRPESE